MKSAGVKEIEVEVLPAAAAGENELARLLAFVLDDLIPIPGTKYRVGLDPLIGLIPGIGDTSTTAFAALLLVRALRAGVPRVVIVRMAVNILINGLVGAIPGAGDLFSAWFKSNRKNYQLLIKHASSRHVSTASDWAFLIGLLALLFAVALTTALAMGWLAWRALTLLFGQP